MDALPPKIELTISCEVIISKQLIKPEKITSQIEFSSGNMTQIKQKKTGVYSLK